MKCQNLVTGKELLTKCRGNVLKTVLETIRCAMGYVVKIGKNVSVNKVAEKKIGVYASNF